MRRVIWLLAAVIVDAQLPPVDGGDREADLAAAIVDARPSPVDGSRREKDANAHGLLKPTRWWRRRFKPARIFQGTLAIYGAATVAFSPIVDPRLVDRAIGGALALAPPVRAAVMASCRSLYTLREAHTLEILLAHEVLTDVSADIIAQAIAADADRDLAIDWPRVPRSAAASLISDDIPFLLWSRYLWDMAEAAICRLRASELARTSPVLVARLTHPVSVTVAKTVVTQLVYETTSNAVYLAIQAGLRVGKSGESRLRRIGAELRSKLFGVWRDGLIFWSAAHMVVFAMPIWWLQPIADNFFTLMFNTYLALVVYKPTA